MFISLEATGFPREYYAISDSKEQRQAFGNILNPMISKTNRLILEERDFIIRFFKIHLLGLFRNIPTQELQYLSKLREKYRIETLYDRKSYLRRIDTIPVSLTLAQAAIESGWGKSRFVKEANNIFGHWTWGKKGIIPEGREDGKTHRIRIFDSLQNSVDEYALNLNRHYAYRNFREAREKAREKNIVFSGMKAAETMLYYSELREKYVKMLQKVMKDSKFFSYDEKITKGPLPLSLPSGSAPILAQ